MFTLDVFIKIMDSTPNSLNSISLPRSNQTPLTALEDINSAGVLHSNTPIFITSSDNPLLATTNSISQRREASLDTMNEPSLMIHDLRSCCR